MKILLSGGLKTDNILSGVAKKFESSNDQFIIEQFIENINEIYARGDYYDRAFITEQSITREYSITDEYELRSRINKFATDCAHRGGKQSFVFFTKDETLANIIYEEILPIEKNSVVVLAEPPYSVIFFHTLLVNDVNQLPSDVVFKPKAIQNEFVPAEDGFESEDGFDVELGNGLEAKNFEVEDLFKDDLANSELANATISDELDINDSSEDLFGGSDNSEFEGGFEGEFEGGFEGEFGSDEDTFESNPDDLFGNSDSDIMNNGFTGVSLGKNTEDSVIDDITPINMSGELPDYIDHTAEENIGLSLDKNNDDMGNMIPGFDTEPDMQEQSFSDDLYGDYVPDDKEFDNDMYDSDVEDISQQLNASGIAMSSVVEGFDDEEYNSGQEIPNNNPMAFNDEDYNNDNQINPAAMAAGAMAGMGVMANELHQQANMQAQTLPEQNVASKKKNWLNKKQKSEPTDELQQSSINSPMPNSSGKVNVNNLKSKLKPFASKGKSMVFTGCGGCGTSIIAYSVANVLSQLGYNVLLVDFDTEGRSQSYMTKSAYDSMDPESANLMSAVNSSTGISNYTSIVKEGLHLLTMGLGSNTAPVNELIHKEKISRFVNVVKTQYNFVIYDIPFQSAVGFLSEIIYMADDTVLVTDASNWGVTKTMISMCNIASDEMQDTMFNRAQFLFNRYRRLHKVFGKKVKTCNDITKIMDEKVYELIGDDIGLHFDNMKISGIINDTPEMEDGWFADVQYSDTAKGQQVFLKLIESIVLE